jgi:type IV pilus assembly protein PilV
MNTSITSITSFTIGTTGKPMMRQRSAAPRLQQGVMMIEALLAILIFSVGILAIVGMQAVAIKSVTDSKTRSDASFLANELMAQMWTDSGNISTYAYSGTGTPPSRLTAWVATVGTRLPGATLVPPIVTVTGATISGAVVQITMRWQLPEEASQGLPPHNFVIIASVYV